MQCQPLSQSWGPQLGAHYRLLYITTTKLGFCDLRLGIWGFATWDQQLVKLLNSNLKIRTQVVKLKFCCCKLDALHNLLNGTCYPCLMHAHVQVTTPSIHGQSVIIQIRSMAVFIMGIWDHLDVMQKTKPWMLFMYISNNHYAERLFNPIISQGDYK